MDSQPNTETPPSDLLVLSVAMLASAVLCSYFLIVLGHVLPKLFASAYGIASASDLDASMPPITKMAARKAWVFALANGVIALAAILYTRRAAAVPIRVLALGLCGEALVVWTAMFCFFYDGFLSGGSLHHDPSFSFDRWVGIAGGAFPITFFAIALTAMLVVSRSYRRVG